MKPGLYVATVHGVENVTTWGPDRHGGFRWFDDDGDVLGCSDAFVTDARPLVVLDPEDPDLPVAHALWEMMEDLGTREFNAVRERIRGVLRALAGPKPAEPTGLGAVVRDHEDVVWLRDGLRKNQPRPDAWWRAGGVYDRRAWDQIDVAEVLSEGWSE